MEQDRIKKDQEGVQKHRRDMEERRVLREAEDYINEVKRLERERFEEESAVRAKAFQRNKTLMCLLEEWGLESAAQREYAAVEAAGREAGRAKEETETRYSLRKQARETAEEQQREADEQMTQHVMQIMRKAGVLAGVNAPEADDFPSQLETAKVVTLYNRPEDEIDKTKAFGKTKGGKASARNFTWFTVDLKVRRVRGEGRGVRGET